MNIKNKSKIPFLKELLKRMEFVEVIEPKNYSAKEKKILSDLDKAVTEVNLHGKGRTKLKTLQQVLNEL